jgi:hypothetical protein
MSTSAGRRSSTSESQRAANGAYYHVPSGPTPPPATETTAMSGTGKPGGARWTPVWALRSRTNNEWIDKNPRFHGNDHQCLTCGRIYGGPHKGEHPDHMVLASHGYDKQHGREYMDQGVASMFRRQHPSASARQIRGMIKSYRETHPYNDEAVPA